VSLTVHLSMTTLVVKVRVVERSNCNYLAYYSGREASGNPLTSRCKVTIIPAAPNAKVQVSASHTLGAKIKCG